ncbi:MAG: aminopeptidase P family protein [Dehalococcoidia bacterium]|nr:aminopeptidase P family protein [Dehalococcoidia bacterium]
MHKLTQAQQALAESGLDAWLLYDFRHSNPLLWQVLGAAVHSTRRVFLLLRRDATPVMLVHQVDAGHFPADGLTIRPYQHLDDLTAQLRGLLHGLDRVAMEYSPLGALPAVSYVDAGTFALVESLGPQVVSSAELAQAALCRLTPQELASHRRAAAFLGQAVQDAFGFIGARLGRVTEHEVQAYLLQRFAGAGLRTDDPPIVAVDAHAGDPHYAPQAEGSAVIGPNQWVLIDLWAVEPNGTYGDLTWVAYTGRQPSTEQRRVFDVVTGARDAAVDFLQTEVAAGRYPEGRGVDVVARAHIAAAGYGAAFTHRLGHSLGPVVHGYGANLDGYETRDTRRLAPGLAFTIEPGVYLPGFGVRSEINLYMESGSVELTSPVQREIVIID